MTHTLVTEEQEVFEMHYLRLHHLPPLGYGLDFPNRKFVVDSEVAPIVKCIWKEALLGRSVRLIVGEIERKFEFRTPTRGKTGGKLLHRNTILNMLKDPFYAGYIRVGTKLCRGLRHEPYVSIADYARVQGLLEQRRKR